MKTKPEAWCILHEEALTLLTKDWQRLAHLKEKQRKSERNHCDAFTNLADWGFAEERRTPLWDGNTPKGERIEFRRAI